MTPSPSQGINNANNANEGIVCNTPTTPKTTCPNTGRFAATIPNGTAKTIAKQIEDSAQVKITDIESIREGEIIGDHKIIFESPVDTIMITHHAKTRDIFAKGALVAAKFLQDKKSGLYTMQDVLGLK